VKHFVEHLRPRPSRVKLSFSEVDGTAFQKSTALPLRGRLTPWRAMAPLLCSEAECTEFQKPNALWLSVGLADGTARWAAASDWSRPTTGSAARGVIVCDRTTACVQAASDNDSSTRSGMGGDSGSLICAPW